jgi:hypothetical protein
MKRIVNLLGILLLFNLSCLAQKVDLDKYTFKCSMLRLPNNYIEPTMRTFDVQIAVNDNLRGFALNKFEAMGIDGYSRTKENPVLNIYGNVNGLRLVNSNIKTNVSETKDKDGKVISTKTTYYVEARYSGTGDFKIIGPKNYYRTLKESTKADSKRNNKAKEKEEAKAKKIADNPFLNNATNTDANATMVANKDYEMQTINESMSRDYTYTGTNYNTYSDASNAWARENDKQLYIQRQKFVDEFYNTLRNKCSWEYGYTITSDIYHLWILDTKSHPEYDLQQKAIDAVKIIMPKLNGTANLTNMANDIKPIMDYFNSIPTKYTGTDKTDKKLRYAAYYNLAKLNYLLDNYNATIDNANLLIKNDYDTEDGEKLINWANELKNQFEFYKVDSRQALN